MVSSGCARLGRELKPDVVPATSRWTALDLWFDLSEVTFLDSSGMHALVAARDNAKARGARFVVICPYGPVLRVLQIAGLDRGLLIYPDRASVHAAC